MNLQILFLVLVLGSSLSCSKVEHPDPTVKELKPEFIISDIGLMEGTQTIVEVKVELKGKHSKSILIPYSTVSVSAEPSYDYEPLDGALAFISNDSIEIQSIFIEIIDNDIFEQEESFQIVFELDTNVVFTKTAINITITDNDFEYTDNDYIGYKTLRQKEGWDLIFSDEFGGDQLNPDNWIQADKGNWYNNELQYYSPNNSKVENGLLTITAKEEVKDGHNYTSSRMWSQHKVHFQYGRIDIRAKLPYSKGIWPALWMMGENRDVVGWPQCGEIDIMELRGHIPNQVTSTIHYKNGTGVHQYPPAKAFTLTNGDFSDKFHVFSMFWSEYRIEFFVDDQRYSTIFHNNFNHFNGDNSFRKEFYILMNLAVGGNFGGNPNSTTIWPQTMDIDYVRVYKQQ